MQIKMPTLTPLFFPTNEPMRVVGLMSGSGSNLRKILEYEKGFTEGVCPYRVVAIFTDVEDPGKSNAVQIAWDYQIPVVRNDIARFYRVRGEKRRDLRKLKKTLDADPNNPDLVREYATQLAIRREFDIRTVESLSSFGAFAAAYAGYMSIATDPLINAFLGINVHPADLSLVDEKGERKYIGDHAVRDAIVAGEKTICSSTHIIEPKVDYGRILMISAPLQVQLPSEWPAQSQITAEWVKANEDLVTKVEKENQGRLKEAGDWIIFPRTLERIARGRFTADETGLLHYDGRPVPQGYRIAA